MHPLGVPDMYCAGELILRADARPSASRLAVKGRRPQQQISQRRAFHQPVSCELRGSR